MVPSIVMIAAMCAEPYDDGEIPDRELPKAGRRE